MVPAFGFDATQAVVMAQLLAALWAFVVNFKYMNRGTILKDISRGTLAVIPLAVMLGFISGFGAVAQSTAAFGALLNGLISLNMTPTCSPSWAWRCWLVVWETVLALL